MSKKNFLFLVLTTVGGLFFAVGMCMCLLPEWNVFKPGVAVTAVGTLALMALAAIRWMQAGKPMPQIDWRKAGKALYCAAALLVFGLGMAMIMAFEGMLIHGIVVGIVGVLMGLGSIPVLKGLK